MSVRSSKPSASPEAPLTPSTAAYRLTHLLNAVCAVHGMDRFPVDVSMLAKDAHNVFHWRDPISEVRAESLGSFEGALYPNEARSKWLLLYNDELRSLGRIRFTQAHELGHYLLHRTKRDQFECTDDDMIDLEQDEVGMESQADSFASTLLMPLDDFRTQMGQAACLESLGECANRYGTSLTATTLRWLSYTEHPAVLVVHRDGYMLWAVPSKPALKAGAFFRTRTKTIEIPTTSLAGNDSVERDVVGTQTDTRIWFPRAENGQNLREMKIHADHYKFTISLLVLPKGCSVWEPRQDN